MGPTRQGQLVDRGPSDMNSSRPGQLVDPEGFRTTAPVPGIAGRLHGPSDPGPGRSERLVNTALPPTKTRVSQDSWSTQRDIENGPNSPGTAGRPGTLGPELETPGRVGQHHGPSGMGPNRPAQLVNPEGFQTQAPVIQDSWLTPRALGPSAKVPGHLVNPTGPRIRARVTRDIWLTPRGLGHRPESPQSPG